MSNSPQPSCSSAEQPLIDPRSLPPTPQPSTPLPQLDEPRSRSCSPSGKRLTTYEHVIFFSCLNSAWLKFDYKRGNFNQKAVEFACEEAKKFGVKRTVTRCALRKFNFDFLKTKNISGSRAGGPKTKELNEEIEACFSEPRMSTRRCAKILNKDGVKCTNMTILNKAKKMGLRFYREPKGQSFR